MPTINQLVRQGRRSEPAKTKVPALGHVRKNGVYTVPYIPLLEKPNSALRKVARFA